jgi:hypothetical protein
MVEVIVGHRLPEQWRGALPAFAAGAGQPWRAVWVVQEREGAALSWNGGARRGGRGVQVAAWRREGVTAWFDRRRKKGAEEKKKRKKEKQKEKRNRKKRKKEK